VRGVWPTVRVERHPHDCGAVALWHTPGGESALVDLSMCRGALDVQSAPRNAGWPVNA
jgi:hypothetical protein